MQGYDVAIVGGGIAGSTAAALLARQGLQVVLCDKGRFPRQKVCGEFLSPEGASVLQRLGVWPSLLGHAPPCVRDLALSTAVGVAKRRLPVPGWGISRGLLDRTLWDYAGHLGVKTYEHCPVRGIEGDWEGGFGLTVPASALRASHLEARAVLIASGRQWKFPHEPRSQTTEGKARFVGLKTHVRGVPLDGQVELHAIRSGYCGLVEVTGGVSNLCCWVTAQAFRREGGTPSSFLRSALRQNPALHRRLHGAEELGRPWYTTSIAARRAVSPLEAGLWNLGDRAAMVAPLTGDGMGMALRAAELAAAHLLGAFRGEHSWSDAPAAYAQQWRREFLPRLRWGRALETILLQPGLASLACLMVKWVPSLTDMLYYRTRHVNPMPDFRLDVR